MAKAVVGLNGFGRIGRAFTRIACERGTFKVGAINTRHTNPELMAYLLQYDTQYKQYSKVVSHSDTTITVGKDKIALLTTDKPTQIPWGEHGINVVIDATGAFTTKPDLAQHLHSGVKKVILTAPSKDEVTPHIVLGVNEKTFNFKKESIISNASCTTNCAAPMLKVLNDSFGVIHGMLTTAHAMTATQSLLDDSGKNKALSRSAVNSIVPTTTGAADAVARVLPDLKGKVDGLSLRVPVPVSSFTDLTVTLKQKVTVEDIHHAFRKASLGSMKGILAYEDEILVSSDYIGNSHSVTYDANYTKVIDAHLVKIAGWYDNEWGYSSRLVDLVERLQQYL